jgi:hypothetical protein
MQLRGGCRVFVELRPIAERSIFYQFLSSCGERTTRKWDCAEGTM